MKKSKILLFFILVFLLILPLNAQQKNRFKFGLYTGWSKGSGDAFTFGYSEYSLERGYSGGINTLKYHIGGYIQYNLAQKFGILLNMNYQRGVYNWEEKWLDLPYQSGKDQFSTLSFSLCGVLSTKVQKYLQTYVLAGGGLSSGKWPGYLDHDVYFNVMGGLGIKIFFLKSNPRVALNLGASFHYLFENPFADDSGDASYFRFQVGFEF